MKWQILFVSNTTLIVQITILFLTWWLKLLENKNTPFLLSIVIFCIGVIGGLLIKKIRKHKGKENRTLEELVISISAVLIAIGLYVSFVTIMYVFEQSTYAFVILVMGIIITQLIAKLATNKKVFNDA